MSLIEEDDFNNDGINVRLPCTLEGYQGADFILRGGDVARAGAAVVSLKNLIGKIPVVGDNPKFLAVSLALDFSVGVAGAFFDEKDAMYSLSSYSKLGATSYSKIPLASQSCGAIGHSYKNMG